LAFGKVGNIDIVKKLVQKRRNSQPHEAHFRHAAYRAIDESLIAIEIQIDEQDLQALKVLYQHLITLPKQERHKGIEDRILWTIYQLEDKGVPKK
jgi:hypothetical protein